MSCGERHARVERRRAGVVAPLRADPGDARGARLLDGDLGGALHHQVPHAVVAVHQRHRGALVHDADVGPHVDAAGLDAPHVLRQADHAVAVGALQVGLGHERGHLGGIGRRQAHPLEGGGDESAQPRCVHPDADVGQTVSPRRLVDRLLILRAQC